MTARSVYLVRGDDPSLVLEASRRLVDQLVGDDDRALVVEEHSGDSLEAAAVANACATAPLFAPRRIIVVRDVGALAADQVRVLADCPGTLLETNVLVMVAGGGALPASLVKAARQTGEIVEAGPGTGRARSDWLSARLRQAPVKLDAAASRRIGAHLGEDLGRLDSLVESLAAAYGEGARLGVEEIEEFLGEGGSVPPWDLTDAVDRGDTAAALEVMTRMLRAGRRHPMVVLSILHRHYASMLRLDGSGVRSDAEAAEVLGSRSTFTAAKTLAQGRRLGHDGISRAVFLLAAADLDMRGLTGWPAETVLEVLVARLSRLGGQRRAASRSRR